MSDSPAFEIGGVSYPIPTTFRLGDPVLVSELTGMEFTAFAERLDDELERMDPRIVLGLIGVAVWQANPRWSRDRVRAFVERIPVDGVKAVGGEEGPQEEIPPAAVPPAGDT